jgi:hypothetical protein
MNLKEMEIVKIFQRAQEYRKKGPCGAEFSILYSSPTGCAAAVRCQKCSLEFVGEYDRPYGPGTSWEEIVSMMWFGYNFKPIKLSDKHDVQATVCITGERLMDPIILAPAFVGLTFQNIYNFRKKIRERFMSK